MSGGETADVQFSCLRFVSLVSEGDPMVAFGSGLAVRIEPSVLSDLRRASTAEEQLAIIGIAAGRGAVALTDDSVTMQPGGVKPFGDGDCVKPFGDGN